MRELRKLKPIHRQALRLIVLGMPAKEAADIIGISHTYMSTVANSVLGREFIRELNDQADDYAARMLALGVLPRHLLRNIDKQRPLGAF